MKRFGLKTAAIALLAGSMIVASVGDAEAQSRRRHYNNNNGAAVGAAIALGMLAFGAAAIASSQQQPRYSSHEFIGYDEWGNPVYQRSRYVAPRAYYEPAPRYVYDQPSADYAPHQVYRPRYRTPRTVYRDIGRIEYNR